MRHRGGNKVTVLAAGFCVAASLPLGAQHDVGDFLTPGIIEQVERQLEHTRDEDGNPLPGWYPQPFRMPIRITVTEPLDVRLQQPNRNLDRIRVPAMSFINAPVEDVVKTLRGAMNVSPRPEDNVNVVLKLSPAFKGPRRLSLEIEETTARRALQKVSDAMGAKLIVEPFGVSIVD